MKTGEVRAFQTQISLIFAVFFPSIKQYCQLAEKKITYVSIKYAKHPYKRIKSENFHSHIFLSFVSLLVFHSLCFVCLFDLRFRRHCCYGLGMSKVKMAFPQIQCRVGLYVFSTIKSSWAKVKIYALEMKRNIFTYISHD